MTEDLSHLGEAAFDTSPELQKAFDDGVESSRQLAEQREKESETIERQVDEETGAQRRDELAQRIAQEDANKRIDQGQGEEKWPQ